MRPAVSQWIYDLPRPLTLENTRVWIDERLERHERGEGVLSIILDGTGEIRLHGKPLAAVETEIRVAEGLVLVPEKRELFGAMTVEDNLVLGAFSRLRRRGTDVGASLKDVYRRFPRLAEVIGRLGD